MTVLTRFFRHLCAVYTETLLLFLLLHLAVAGSFENTVIRPEAFLLLLPFAAGLALAAVLYAVKSMPHTWRLILHFAICVLSAYVFLYLPAGTGASGGMRLLMLLLIAVIYWIIMGTYLALSAAKRRSREADVPYTSMFKK